MSNPILQFGTSRFLQAHADLFVSEALAAGTALGPITVVQTTASASSAARLAAFNQPGGYPVRIRGRAAGKVIEREQRVTSITAALHTDRDWARIRAAMVNEVQVVLSNTGDMGYMLSPHDHAGLLQGDVAPVSFPAKLLVLLAARFHGGGAPITLLPCELVSDNGRVLRDIVLQLARDWNCAPALLAWLEQRCVWLNSLVDRIVSEALEPAGAVAEPYALWAIEAQPGMVLPCTHPDIVVTAQLAPYERRKLFLLNLGHTFLAECWLNEHRSFSETVGQAMADPLLRARLCALWEQEVLPLFDALGEARESRAYLAQVRDRFDNPFLAHRLADIAQNHAQKVQRRVEPVLALADSLGLALAQPRLRAMRGAMVAA